ncbi:hypothetical protein ACFWYW_57475 [Nonomuraea sp. NPDC059023]|uniref:hypothetical protein n=1 Tax=unclassified Nonomuraea TaxID=2593643 RepID=UPI0036A8359B
MADTKITSAADLAVALLDDIEDGKIPGSPIRYRGEEIWLHTTGQVEGWLRTRLEQAGLIQPVEDDWTPDAEPAAKHGGEVITR